MTADSKLLPLPKWMLEAFTDPTIEMLCEYTRANVAHTTAPLQAEIEALRAEVAFYRRRCDALQAMQIRMRDPERQMVCDVLANGQDREAAGVGSYAALGGEDERG